MDGGVSCDEETRTSRGQKRRRLKLGLFAVSEIEGDIDYSTGHVDFHGDVVVKGSVRALFRVKATGSVTIGENVETGARIEAGGDILISGGVVGETTVLHAGGNVMAKFLQQAEVQAGGDVEVGAYLFEASVRAGGQVRVAGAGEGSGRAMVGGLVWAGKGIETASLGSPTNPQIRIVAGIDPTMVAKSDEVRAKIRACEAKEREALDAMGMKQLDPQDIKRRARAAEPERKAALLEHAKQLAEYAGLHQELQGRLEQMAQSQREQASTAMVVVSGAVAAGPELRLGEQVLRIEQDVANVRYRLVEEDGQVRIETDQQ
jgi:uncharacterized protein (DUF342 family)